MDSAQNERRVVGQRTHGPLFGPSDRGMALAQRLREIIAPETPRFRHSFANLATGESGQRLSSHYKDQWDAHYAGRSFPMPFSKVKAKDVLVVKPAN